MSSLLRCAYRVLQYEYMPEFDMTRPEGLRDKAAWMERKRSAFDALSKHVQPKMREVEGRARRKQTARYQRNRVASLGR